MKWHWLYPGALYADSATLQATTERDARAEIRQGWYPKLARLPAGFAVWRDTGDAIKQSSAGWYSASHGW